jgi:hypothetical protein
MARGTVSPVTPWRTRALTFPPRSWSDWLRLAAWELWMGSIVGALLWAGGAMIATSPDRIITAEDLSGCYASPPVVRPCERIVYRTGAMNAAFSVLTGMVMTVAAFWLLWELWVAVAPKPIMDDFLRLLHDSFARNLFDPRTWPWSRVLWAYGFAAVGAAVSASLALAFWSALASATPPKAPVVKVNTSQDFRLGQ